MVAVMATAALVVVAGGAASPAPIGKRGCETRCGDVSVPYPFGFGQDRCSAAPGFKLNCVHGNTTDMSSGGAGTRLLLGDHGDFEVKEISVKNRTIRGLSRPVFINATINNTGHSTVRSMGFGDNRWQYFLPPTSTELVVTGCNVQIDIDECKQAKDHGCFGECRNTQGSFNCWCARGGNASQPNGCLRPVSNTGLIIGLLVSLVPSLMLLVIGGLLIIRKLEHHRAEKLKRKFFNQNHGQLLQQLVSQRSDIGERMIITMKEIEKATNNFDQSRKLGGGGHGTVYKGILSDLHVVAIKKSNIMVQREIDEFINEVAILSQINHRNIVKLHGCCLETEVTLLAYEFISNGTLGDHLHNDSPKSISWGDRLRIGCEVGRAIAYLHSAVSVPVIHRDIKSSNILLDDAFTAKLSDFGASRYIPIDQSGRTATAVQGTIGYLDPMYYYAGRLSEKSDVYSFRILLLELFTRKIPIMYRTSEGKLVDILDSQIVEEGGSEVEEVAALAASCIKLRGEERPTMRQVEMALEGIQANKQLVLNDLTGEQNEENDSISTSLSLEEVS
ncbi:putative wall-associated receptor kinase-like 16 [Triticum dicoccoides]|uniref:putative wall-associated receptor kinase-like 16 n=1 Tax=Triticum dicoccoides TaxID=85692 RepID=UPI0018916C13|nr:putative wall-associated receptor kinase-like 16 [Triticum dicoccoides]